MDNLLNVDNKKQPAITPENASITSQDNSKYAPKFIDADIIKNYKLQGLTNKEIAKLLDCHPSNIFRRLLNIDFTSEELEEAKKIMPQLKLADYLRYRSYITPAKLKKASAGELAKMVSFKYNEYCLETGKATVNVGITAHDLTRQRSIEQEQKANDSRRKEILAMLVDVPEPVIVPPDCD